MISIGIDTSHLATSVAIANEDGILIKKDITATESSSKYLPIKMEECLKELDLSPNDINIAGVVTGPGSFTGLRIGISFIMGFCRGVNIKVVPFSSLEVMAYWSGLSRVNIRSVIDARRKEMFTALYSDKGGKLECVEDVTIKSIDSLHNLDNEKIVCIDKGFIPKEVDVMELDKLEKSGSSVVAMLAIQNSENAVLPYELKPNYIRLSAAEEKFKQSEN